MVLSKENEKMLNEKLATEAVVTIVLHFSFDVSTSSGNDKDGCVLYSSTNTYTFC